MPVNTDAELTEIFELSSIAVVGASRTHGTAAHNIPGFLQWVGYDVIPVNPNADEVLGRRAYDTLTDVAETVDVVQVFRPSAEVAGIVEQVLDREDVQVVWLQPGITDPAATERAEDAGLRTVSGRCMGVEYRRLKG